MYGALNGMMVAPMIRTPLACAALISVWYPAMSWPAVTRGVWPQSPEIPFAVPDVVGAFEKDDRADSGLAECVALESGDALLAEARQPVEQHVAADPAVGHGQRAVGADEPSGQRVRVPVVAADRGVVTIRDGVAEGHDRVAAASPGPPAARPRRSGSRRNGLSRSRTPRHRCRSGGHRRRGRWWSGRPRGRSTGR